MAVLGLGCCAGVFSSCWEQGLLIATASLVLELWVPGCVGSVAVACRLCCYKACGIFLDHRWNRVPCIGRQILIHWATTTEVSVENTVNNSMAYWGQGQKVQKVKVQPINLIFRYLQNRSRIQVWLYEQVNMRIEGCIIGFDEYMNLILDDAEEIHSKTKSRKQLVQIMLKGDSITLLQSVSN